jgi:hypothetical protein
MQVEVTTSEPVITSVTLTLTPEEAKVVRVALGRCSGAAAAQRTGISSARAYNLLYRMYNDLHQVAEL